MAASSRPRKSVLLLVDIQDGLTHPTHWGPTRSNPSFEANAELLLTSYRTLVVTSPTHKIIHIQHSSLSDTSPLHPTKPGFAFQTFARPQPRELVITKSVNSAFIGTSLEAVLREHFAGQPGFLCVAGLTTDHCVSTTVRMAGNLGVADGQGGERGEVVLVEDATAAHQKGAWDAETVHAVHVESLKEFASVRRTGDVVEAWRKWAGK